MNPEVDLYLSEGCGRCPLGGTSDCKVHLWTQPLEHLRRIVLECGLTETRKWGVPCYTFHQSNILIVAAFKEYCSISFFKGALLQDTHHILDTPGENTQAARLIRFTEVREILELEPLLQEYIYEAIEVEKTGLKVEFKKSTEFPIPEEFQLKMDEMPVLKAAFQALSPGRQRGYLLYFSQAKQSKTRSERVEKCLDGILLGKGLQD